MSTILIGGSLILIYLYFLNQILNDIQAQVRFRIGNKDIWMFAVVFGSIIGLLLYIYLGRE